MQVVVFEDSGFSHLLPLVYWRAVFELRCGQDSLLDKVRRAYPSVTPTVRVRDALGDVVQQRTGLSAAWPNASERTLFLNGRLRLEQAIDVEQWPSAGVLGESIVYIAADAQTLHRLSAVEFTDTTAPRRALDGLPVRDVAPAPRGLIGYPWDLVHANRDELLRQWGESGCADVAGRIDAGAWLLNESAIYVGEGSRVKPCSVLDAEDGPIVIGRNVTVSPNCTIQGPCYIGDGTLIQPGAVIRDGTSIGPVCKVGGEVEASIIHGFSNKQHDGFLGHSYLGEWINIAADCINSDLKNTYGEVSVPINGVDVPSGETFVGLTMGDHAKSGVNLSFPTGAVVGFASNVFLSRHPPKFVPSFSWYTDDGRGEYETERAIDVARKVMARRKRRMSAAEEQLFRATANMAHEFERQPATDD